MVLCKACVHIIDTQTLKESLENGQSHALVSYQCVYSVVCTVLLNLISSLKIVVPLSISTAVVCAIKVTQAENIDSNLKQSILADKDFFIYLVIFVFLFIFFMHITLAYGVNEVIKAWNLRDMMQEEIIILLDNLEEAIITKNDNIIDLCNEQGTKIIDTI